MLLYGFDEQVRLSELRDGDSVITYGYDETGRLAEKQSPNRMETKYRYDRKGQIQELIHKDREGILDRYRYEYDLLGNKIGIEKQRRGLEEGKEYASYYLQDELGSPIRLAEEDGKLSQSYGYDEFGQDLYGNQGVGQPFGYTGYQKDGVAGTYFAQAREYGPCQGRFLSEDIIKGCIIYPDTLNQYTYCWNNPIIYVDNDGEFLATIAIGAGIGALIGGAGSIISDISKGQKVDWEKAGKNALKGGAAGAVIGTGIGAVSALSAAGASAIAVNTTVAATAGASFRAGADIVTSIKNKEMTISNPNRYVTSAVSAAALYNSFRFAPRSSALGILVQGASDFIAGDLSSFESYAGAALSTTLISKYISNPTQLQNLLGIALGTGTIQLVEMAGGVQQFSIKTIGKEIGLAVLISLIAGKLGSVEKLKEVLGEDEWGAILDGLRRRIGACNND